MYARASYFLNQPLTNIYTDSTQQQLQQQTQLQPQQPLFQYCINNTNTDINYLGQPVFLSPSAQQLYVQPIPQQYILPQQHKPLILLPDNKYALQQQQQQQQQQLNNIMQFQTTKKRPLQELQEESTESVSLYNNNIANDKSANKDNNDNTNKSSTAVDTNIETKKQKLDELLTEKHQKTQRSSIVTCKGLPSNVSEAEVIQFFAPFGSVSGMLLDPIKNTAQVEMTNEADVEKLLAHYHNRPPVLKGHVLRFYEGETTSSIQLVPYNQNINNELLLQQQVLQQHPLLQQQQQLLQHQALFQQQQQHYYIQQAQQQKYLAIKQPLMLASNDLIGSALSSEFVSMTTPVEYTTPVAFNNNSLLNNVLLQHKQLLPLGNVLLVSNLNEEKVTPDALFILFGVYGDVTKVKVMYNKKDTALIQLSDPVMTQTALLNLDNLRLWDKVIKVAPSKHTVVQSPKDGAPDAGLTKDYTNSPLHRFKKPHSKNFSNIFPPSSTLHLSNVPNTTTKEHLTALFSQQGCVVGFKFFNNVVSANKECRMALMQMASVQEAAHALIALHNHQLAETIHLRVSFSKSSVLTDQQLQQQLLLTSEKTIQKQQSTKQAESDDSKQKSDVEKEELNAPIATVETNGENIGA